MPIDLEKLKALAQAAKAAEHVDPRVEPEKAAVVDEYLTTKEHAAYVREVEDPDVMLELIAELEAARAVLREVEWGNFYQSEARCPVCNATHHPRPMRFHVSMRGVGATRAAVA